MTTDAQLLDRDRLQPAFLAEITLLNSGPTLYLSDRELPGPISGQFYEHYIDRIEGLGEEIRRNDSTFNNLDITIHFLNEAWKTYPRIVEVSETYPIEGAAIVLKRTLIDDAGTMTTPVIMAKGALEEPGPIDLMEFSCKVSSTLHQAERKWNQLIIDKTTWPNAWEDVGMYEPIIIGAAGSVPCPRVDWGVKTTLVADITDVQTATITMTDKDSRLPSSGTIIIDNEEISFTGYSSRTLGGTVTRGANSTTKTYHQAGATVWLKQTNYDSLIAGHECHSFGDVLAEIAGQFWRVTSGVSQVLSSGKHLLRATAQIKVAPLSVGISTGSHSHASAGTTIRCNGTSGSLAYYGGSAWTNTAANLYDQSDTTKCYKSCSGAEQVGSNASAQVNFPAWGGGSLLSAYVCVRHSSSKSGNGTVRLNGISGYGPITLDTSGAVVTQKFSTGTTIYNAYVDLDATFSGDVASSNVYEIWYEVAESATGASAATGVALTGGYVNTASVDRFHISVNGAKDTAGGTYTGTANALIERPDHVFKYLMIAKLSYVAGDLNSASFSAAGTSYASAISGGYKFGFAILDKIKPSVMLMGLAKECRSILREQSGSWYLDYLPASAPAAAKTILSSDLAKTNAQFVFSKTSLSDIANSLTARLKKDYSRLKSESEWLLTSTASDATSIAKYGSYPLKVDFLYVRLQAMADHVLAHMLLQQKKPLRRVKFPIDWAHFDAVAGSTIDISNPLYNGLKVFIERFINADEFQAECEGLEWY